MEGSGRRDCFGRSTPAMARRTVSTRSAKLGRGDEYRWWLRHWTTFDQGGKGADDNSLPRRRDDFEKLPEANHLKPLVFGNDQNGKRRLSVAHEVAKASAIDHIEICADLGRVFGHDCIITKLPRFSRLADAGMEAMDLVAKSLQNKSRVELAEVAALPQAVPVSEALMAGAQEWRKDTQMQLRHIETAHRFVSAIPSARPIECLRALLQHHELYGGGLRWFVSAMAGSSRARPGAAVRRATASACGPSAGLPRNVASSATCRGAAGGCSGGRERDFGGRQ